MGTKALTAEKVRKIHLVSKKLVDTLFAGNYHSVFKGPGLEFHEVREYQMGDDARFIDWNVTSRTTGPYLKTFKEERELVLFAVVDVSPSLSIGSQGKTKMETAGLLFGMLGLAAVANNDRVGSLLFSDKIESVIPPQKGKNHVLRQILQLLNTENTGRGSDLSSALRMASEILKSRSIIVVLSDFRTTGFWKDLAILAKKNDVIAVRVSDPLDRHFPEAGLIDLEDPETGDTLAVFGASTRFQEKYNEYWEYQRLSWLNNCQQYGIDTLDVGTEEDPGLKLMQFFDRRKV
jgi:uncharacterized protein (DUF58 family)